MSPKFQPILGYTKPVLSSFTFIGRTSIRAVVPYSREEFYFPQGLFKPEACRSIFCSRNLFNSSHIFHKPSPGDSNLKLPGLEIPEIYQCYKL